MALLSYSKFYYGFRVTQETSKLDFIESGVLKTAELTIGDYTLAGIATEVARAFNIAGSQQYSVSADRATRRLTISAAGPFSLLPFSGSHTDWSAYRLIGFDLDIDLLDGTSFEGQEGAGEEYLLQFPLQSYVPARLNRKAIEGTRKKTITGVIEATKFGVEKRMECELLFITDIPQDGSTPLRTLDDGVEKACKFLDFATDLGFVEFMVDENRPSEFEVYRLDSTDTDPNGLGYVLYEDFDKGLPDYFHTGKLTWILQESK
ncbi:MAG: hypothetical protein J7501_09145 [Bdellovibrio sp.]|nr:hypothetical protein [Bdellovibrio sp.]